MLKVITVRSAHFYMVTAHIERICIVKYMDVTYKP